MSRWYAIVDCAADSRLYDLITSSQDYACLYSGKYDAETRKALPYIVAMQNGEKFSKIWTIHEAGQFWGILCKTEMNLAQLRRHLRHFTTAQLPAGEVVMFRFWDPRVFVTFTENGSAKEVGPFLKGIDIVLCDLGENGRKQYTWQNGLSIDDVKPKQVQVS